LAINSTDVPTTGTSIEIDVTTLILQAVVTVAVSVGGGTLLGYFMSERSRKKQKNEDIQKVKTLLKDDFERLNELAVNDLMKIYKAIHSLRTDDSFLDNLFSNKLAMGALVGEIIPKYEFNFWELIRHSSLMINLQTQEIRELEADHDFMAKKGSRANEQREKNFQQFRSITDSLDPLDIRKLRFKYNLTVILHSSLSSMVDIYEMFVTLDIDWISTTKWRDDHYKEAKRRIENYLYLLKNNLIEDV